MTTGQSAIGSPGRRRSNRSTLILAAAAGTFGSLDTSLNIAFPDLLVDLDIEVGDLRWVVVSYVLSYGAALLAAGQIGDIIDHRLLVGLGALGSAGALAICAIAPTFGWFLMARVAQGLGTAMVMAGAPALAAGAAEIGGRGRALGVFSAATGFGAAIGPGIGGPLVTLGGWPAVFWFRVPLAAGLALLTLFAGREAGRRSPDRTAGRTEATAGDGIPVEPTEATAGGDIVGAILLAVGWSSALLVITSVSSLGFGSPLVLGMVSATAVLSLVSRWWARHHPTPVLAPGLLTTGPVARAALLAVLANGSMFVAWLLVPSLAVDQLDSSPAVAGLALAAAPLAMALVAPATGRWLDRTGGATVTIVGLTIQATGLAILATTSEGTSMAMVAGAMALVGAGLGIFSVANLAEIMAALPGDRQGTGGGLALLLRTVGIVAGVAGSAALFAFLEPGRSFIEAFRLTTAASFALAVAAVAVALSRRVAPE